MKQIAMIVATEDMAVHRTNFTPDGIRAYPIFGPTAGPLFDDIWVELDPMHSSFHSKVFREKVIASLDDQWLCRATPEGEEKVRAEINRFKEKLAILCGETSEGE